MSTWFRINKFIKNDLLFKPIKDNNISIDQFLLPYLRKKQLQRKEKKREKKAENRSIKRN